MTLSVGQHVTHLKIDSFMAMTHRYELEVLEVLEPAQLGYQKENTRLAVIRQRGKRKRCYLDLKSDEILLNGWDLPFRADTEGSGVMQGNACFNVVGDPAAIRQLIETRAAWPISDKAKAQILVARASNDDPQELLYPEIETHHAVINRMKETKGVQL